MVQFLPGMIYLISSRGRGSIAFFLIFLPVLFLVAGTLISEDAMLPAFGVGWIVSGVTCFILGRHWNRQTRNHLFGPLKLETWGLIYGAIGTGLILLFLMGLNAERSMRKPIKRPTVSFTGERTPPRRFGVFELSDFKDQ